MVSELDTIEAGNRVTVWRKHRMNVRRKKGFRTICEVLRELYHDAEQRSDPLSMTRIEEATDMAKRMQTRLNEYAGSKRVSLISTVEGLVWLGKDQLMQLTADELALVYAHREAATMREHTGNGSEHDHDVVVAEVR